MAPAAREGRTAARRVAVWAGGKAAHSARSLAGRSRTGRPVTPPPRRRRVARIAVAVLVVVGVAAVVAALVPVPYDAITPGKGVDVATLVTVPARQRHAHEGAVVLTDVELVPLRALTYVYYSLQGGDQVVSTSELTGPSTPQQYDEQGVIDMANARRAAKVVALRRLGYPVRAIPDGVIVYATVRRSPAAAHLALGEVLTAVDGRPVTTVASLQEALAGRHPGDPVTLREHRLDGTHARRVRLRLGKVRTRRVAGGAVEACLTAGAKTTLGPPPAGAPSACLGITAPTLQSEQSYRLVGLPFRISLDSEGIVGPSAGLSFTLGLLDVLAKGDLTGGRRVAATGTMSVTGQVGDVGGVPQKTAAVRAAGATVFLVPTQEVAAARAHAGAHLQVLGVSSIGEAIKDLERLGGRLGPLPAPTRP